MLPQLDALPVDGAVNMPSNAPSPERPIRILLVEDDEDDYLITRELLKNSGQYELDWVCRYSDGLARLERSQIDACLIDYRIGGRTGLEFVQEAIAKGTTVPMILLTGIGDRDVDVAAARVGAADYLDKSDLSAKVLERSIRYALRHTQAILALKEVTEQLERAKIDLETKVIERTQELATLNENLKKEIQERKRVESQIRHDAFYDRLTDLPNRALLLDRISHVLRRSRRSEHRPFALLLINIDRFQTVNDALGHSAGDELLVTIAKRLSMLSRPCDTVARIGGNDFAWLIDDVPADVVPDCAQRVKDVFAAPIKIDAQEIHCTASVGFTTNVHGYIRAEGLVHDAYLALRSAKSRGKDRFEQFRVAMRKRTDGRLSLESDLRSALKHGESFELYYQPILDTQTERAAGFEALIRWRHPERGLVGPNEFMPIAEETGLVVPLGRLVIDMATHTLKKWYVDSLGRSQIFLSVNISPRQLMDDGLVDDVRGVLANTDVPAECLKLEITESMLMTDPELACSVLKALKALGVGLSIDDFGTGYSSLSYLRQFPFDVVKIDRALIRAMNNGLEDEAVVETILKLAKILNMEVIAEGVETRAEVACLAGMGCRLVQGFYIAPPLPSKDAEARIKCERADNAVAHDVLRLAAVR